MVSWLVTDRFKGVSSKPYDALNLALHVGDRAIDVFKNRTILTDNHNLCLENLIYMDQTHSDNIQIIRDSSLNKIEDCDSIITNLANTPLMVMVADCIPILIWDDKKNVIAAVHAGRKGTFKEISKKTVLHMAEHFDCKKEDINIHLGVSINSCCYEVSRDLADITIKNFGAKYIIMRDNKYFLDLQTLNFDQLISVGIKEKNIDISKECSCCNKDYFSYRRDGITGRFAGVIVINGSK
ncbi:MAG TPA: peptidoglycan editing factor PgeF [Campylobacterales bacterium]|nr:peptidoglycan editing factor PgeF [Campylobacterales bacterium]